MVSRTSSPLSVEQQILGSCACLKVRMASRAITKAYDEALRPSGLRITQLTVLVALACDGAQSITSLATSLGMDRSTLKRTLSPLEDEGLVAVSSEGWRRSRMLEITRPGQSRLQKAIPLWEQAQHALIDRLGPREWKDVQGVLGRLIAAA